MSSTLAGSSSCSPRIELPTVRVCFWFSGCCHCCSSSPEPRVPHASRYCACAPQRLQLLRSALAALPAGAERRVRTRLHGQSRASPDRAPPTCIRPPRGSTRERAEAVLTRMLICLLCACFRGRWSRVWWWWCGCLRVRSLSCRPVMSCAQLLECVLTSGAPAMSTRRKLMMASWATPSESQVFGIINVNAEPLLAYLDKVRTPHQHDRDSRSTAEARINFNESTLTFH